MSYPRMLYRGLLMITKALNAMLLGLFLIMLSIGLPADPREPQNKLILIWRAFDNNQTSKVQWKDLAKRNAPYDIVVEINKISREGDQIHIEMEEIGRPLIVGVLPKGSGLRPWGNLNLIISKIPPSTTDLDLIQALKTFLMTPEEYLAFHKIKFTLPPVDDNDKSMAAPVNLSSQSGLKTVSGIINPYVILKIQPFYTEEARQNRRNGVVRLQAILGIDGRIHSPKILVSLQDGLDDRVLKTLPLWRSEPAHQGTRIVASEITLELGFYLH
jgi:TonB family protein